MTDRFEYCLKHVLVAEGGISDHKADRGGLTNMGITYRTYDAYRMSKGLQLRPVYEIEFSEVKDIYFNSYWLPASCHKMPEPLDLLVFDFAVNSGPTRAVKYLQKCLDVEQDGRFGLKSSRALFAAEKYLDQLCETYINERKKFINKITANDPNQKVFLKGWMNRIARLEDATSTYST